MVTLRRAGRLQRQCKNEPTPTTKPPAKATTKPPAKASTERPAKIPVYKPSAKIPAKSPAKIPAKQTSKKGSESAKVRRMKGAPLEPPSPIVDVFDISSEMPDKVKPAQKRSTKRKKRAEPALASKLLDRPAKAPAPDLSADTIPEASNIKTRKRRKSRLNLSPPAMVGINNIHSNTDSENVPLTTNPETWDIPLASYPKTSTDTQESNNIPSTSDEIPSTSDKIPSTSDEIPSTPESDNLIPPPDTFQVPSTLHITNSKKRKSSEPHQITIGARKSSRVSVPVTPLGVDATPSNVDDSGISDSILDSPKDFKPRKTPQVTTTSETDITKQADQSKDQSKLVNQSKELANQSKVYSSKQGYKRKQKVDSDMALEVSKEIAGHSICNILSQPKRKKKAAPLEPSFECLSPIKSRSKLEELEKSMNLFQCDLTPIGTDKKQSTLDQHVQKKSLAPNKKSKSVTPKKGQSVARTTPKKGPVSKLKEKGPVSKLKEKSLLKTPIRNVFSKSRVDCSMNSSIFSDTFDIESEEDDADETAEFPVFTKHQPKKKAGPSKSEEKENKPDYGGWLVDHCTQFSQFNDIELVIE